MRSQFRSYFQHIVDMMLRQKESIKSFIKKGLKEPRKKSPKKKALRKHSVTRRV